MDGCVVGRLEKAHERLVEVLPLERHLLGGFERVPSLDALVRSEIPAGLCIDERREATQVDGMEQGVEHCDVDRPSGLLGRLRTPRHPLPFMQPAGAIRAGAELIAQLTGLVTTPNTRGPHRSVTSRLPRCVPWFRLGSFRVSSTRL